MARCRTCWSDRPAVSGCPACNPQQLENQLRETRQRLYDVEAGNRALRDDAIGDARRSSNMRDAISDLETQIKALQETAIQTAAQISGLEAEIGEHKRDAQAQYQARRAAECQLANTEGMVIDVRPAVRAFAVDMEARLRANDHKGGWDTEEQEDLYKRILEESKELKTAIADAVRGGNRDEHKAAVIKEAADVANFAMMIADNARHQL